MHWFDPFGSVDSKDLCSQPLINNINGDATRYLFWDQEPVHLTMIEKILPLFADRFDGDLTVVTSELNSENVDYIKQHYRVNARYYFFHGWAALDWYRGYNRSFLITDPKTRNIEKTFISPNRILGGERPHRLLMLYHIFKNNLGHNWISCPAVCPGERVSIHDLSKKFNTLYADIADVFAQQSLPINFPKETNHPMHSYCLSLFDESFSSLLYLVTETVATGRRLHLTEKTFKPICLKMPFVLVGTAGSLEYLKSYGFKTFNELWDESYDNEADDVLRLEKIRDLLINLDNLTTDKKQHLFEAAIPIVEHNFNHFYNGGFEQILWNELSELLTNIKL